MNKHAIILALAGIFGLAATSAIAGGGHDHSHGSSLGRPGDPAKVERTVRITMGDDMRFRPARIQVRKGETIRFELKNVGKLEHEMVIGSARELREHAEMMKKHPEMEHAEPNQASVEPGQTGTLIWQFSDAGMVDFACLEPGHFEAGMKGRVAVK